MIDNHFRKILPQYTDRLIATYQQLGLTPNQITLLGLPVAMLAAFFVSLEWNLLAIATWWLGRLLDGTDGIYARATGQTSPFGAYLDIVCDMAAYSFMIFGFYLAYPDHTLMWLVILFFYVLCIASALALGNLEQESSIAAADNRGLRLGAGLAEAGETGIAYTIFLLAPTWIGFWGWLWILILIVTIVARTMLARQVLQVKI